MNKFHRDNPRFSLCGLNCCLCQLYVGGYCPGCGGKGGRACAIARCSAAHGSVQYCFLCDEYPCKRYEDFDEYDTVLPTRTRKRDIARAKECGMDAYMVELSEKEVLLSRLLDGYNDGRQKSFFLTAVYLLELTDLQAVHARLPARDVPVKERAAAARALLSEIAALRGIELKPRKKPKDQ